MSQVSGISPQSDESIQSFMLRVMLRIGRIDDKSILINGRWRCNPCVPYDIKKYFNVYGGAELFDLFKRQRYLSSKYNPFDNFTSSERVFWATFFPCDNKQHCGSNVPLRFCRSCIEKQIHENGFSYFKMDWLYVGFCEVHSIPLIKVKKSMPSSKVKKILRSIFQADWAEVLDGVSEDIFHQDELDMLNELKFAREDRFIRFSPCAKEGLVKYLVSNSNFSLEVFSGIANNEFLTETERNLLLQRKKIDFFRKHLEEACEYELENNSYSLIKYCLDYLEVMDVRYFGIDKWVVKKTNIKCKDCLKSNVTYIQFCMASGLIKSTAGRFLAVDTPCDGIIDSKILWSEHWAGRLRWKKPLENPFD